MDKRLIALYIWLVVEVGINLYFGFVFIPSFFIKEDFVKTEMVSLDEDVCKPVGRIKNMTKDMAGNSASTSVTQMFEVMENISTDKACFEVKGEKLWNTALGELTWDGGPADPNDKREPPPQKGGANLGKKIPHMLNGVVLTVCGFIAPSGECLIRVIKNIFVFGRIEDRCPGLDHKFHAIYEILHGPLQHLTQFKLYLCFLQMLMSVNVGGINVMSMASGEGIGHFVIFVAWSIFINTVVKKIEKPILKGLPLDPHVLPHPDWVPKLISKYTGSYANCRVLLNIIKLGGFYLFYTLPVFTLIFSFELKKFDSAKEAMANGCTQVPGDIGSVKYYTDSFSAIREGFNLLVHSNGNTLMFIVLVFQFYICNLITPVVQLVHAVLQEYLEGHAPQFTPWGWYVKHKDRSATHLMEADREYTRLSQGAVDKWKVHSSGRKFMSLVLQCCVENQAHEYFVCALIMLIFVMMTVLGGLGLDHKEMSCGTFTLQFCYNPFICVWLVLSVAMLGRARAKLYVQDEEAGSMVQWTARFQGKKKYTFLLIFWIILVLVMAYALVFSNPKVTNYFGRWTMNSNYIKDNQSGLPFNCLYSNKDGGGRMTNCISVLGKDGKAVSNQALVTDGSAALQTMMAQMIKSDLFKAAKEHAFDALSGR